jgi:NADH:ubiquinone oxidoreductase subunit F (NADH-binding)
MPGAPRLGCGVLVVLPESACPVRETALILRFLAAETADQCGPCVLGLPAMAKAMAELYAGGGSRTRDRLLRWSGQLQGRGACRHPDTAVSLVRSLLDVFEDEVATHDRGVCTGGNTRAIVPLPGGRSSQEWR